MEKQLIVGIDPGTSVGLAFLDVDGNVLGVKSMRNISIDDIITQISIMGTAIVVATDKGVSPPVVTKVAGILGARLFTPDSDLLVEKKRELAGKAKTENDHERDSLAAAVYAYYHFQNKIRRIEKQVEEELEKIKARVLKGEKVSDILAPGEVVSRDGELNAQITALRKENRELRGEIDHLKRAQPKNPQDALREAVGKAKGLMSDVAKDRLVILKEVSSLNYLDLKDLPIKQGDYIFCRAKENDGKGLRLLESRRVGAIISPVKVESLAPSCLIDDLELISWEGLFFADPYDIGKKCGRRKEVAARDLHDMLFDYKKGRR